MQAHVRVRALHMYVYVWVWRATVLQTGMQHIPTYVCAIALVDLHVCKCERTRHWTLAEPKESILGLALG